jgi:hypothetical protein
LIIGIPSDLWGKLKIMTRNVTNITLLKMAQREVEGMGRGVPMRSIVNNEKERLIVIGHMV